MLVFDHDQIEYECLQPLLIWQGFLYHMWCTVQHDIIEFFMMMNKFQKYPVADMDRGHSPISSGAKIKLITSVVAEKNTSKVGKIMKEF